ncbi:PREDICTED: proteinase inhibitor type-2 TR8-like [Ipomoea nil]|uniref:proteinase inhibitor type-2 TR8-like n=1 Tax=Ipomoea nil TaxID=35883 RepID=UPI000900CE27|nr:PREDICTED: proteinase inhibitor type-2 TR8-like [Ipomoea nil]
MAITKLGFVTLLLLCAIVMVVKNANAQEMKPCTKECDGRAEYMICPRLPGQKVKQVADQLCMNCCAAENMGCILFDQKGTAYCHEEERSFIRKMATMV